MKKEIIYRTQTTVMGMLRDGSTNEVRVLLKGEIARCTDRRLLGVIPLPDRYKWKVTVGEQVKIGRGCAIQSLNENSLTFNSRKCLTKERLYMEGWLRNKCKEYKKKYGKRW